VISSSRIASFNALRSVSRIRCIEDAPTVEHVRHVRDPQLVQPHPAQVRHRVGADVGLPARSPRSRGRSGARPRLRRRTVDQDRGGARGAERAIGLDLSTAMLDLIRAELPTLCVVRGIALRLPFTTGSLGAVNCSNALQLLPDPRTVIQEIGRCPRPG